MNYYSLNGHSGKADFREATLKGQAPDGGLYFPESIPKYPQEFFLEGRLQSDTDFAFRTIQPFVGKAIPEDDLRAIVAETLDFPFPLVPVTGNIFSLELFHGNTLAFKDVGARFMSRCLRYFVRGLDRRIIVLVATSGDTGGAVADGFFDIPGIDVVILYPSGKVSDVQEAQLTSHGKNIHALEVAGNFDDCQAMVKKAFTDNSYNNRIFLTSANSINVARWLPQQFFYYLAFKHWPFAGNIPVISVPSGNFGNICAGLLAKRSGLPVDHFIAACNANDAVPRFLETGIYQPNQAVHTISNAMDVGNPSNFSRVLELFDGNRGKLSAILSSTSVTDAETRERIAEVFKQTGYILDPHGAVAFTALEKYLGPGNMRGIFLETAHPVKFCQEVETLTNWRIPRPGILNELGKVKHAKQIGNEYEHLKDFLTSLA